MPRTIEEYKQLDDDEMMEMGSISSILQLSGVALP
jgi:hypothetical protein